MDRRSETAAVADRTEKAGKGRGPDSSSASGVDWAMVPSAGPRWKAGVVKSGLQATFPTALRSALLVPVCTPGSV